MTQPVNAIRVFIAGPDDVIAEREAAVGVIHMWNASHSLDRRTLVEPVRMETHAMAALGDHPQAIINRQLLDRCDFLIAIFWSRLGTPTPKAPSGTVQEIKEFVERKGGENVLLFFSKNAYPSDVDLRELKRLKRFKNEMKNKGLYIPFENVESFSELLRHQIEMRIGGFVIPDGVLVSQSTVSMVTLEPDGAGTRTDDFRTLRTEAQRSIYVMGVGMTLFSTDVTLMRRLLQRPLSIRLLMIDPDVISQSKSQRARRDSPSVSIMDDSFSAFFSRRGYGSDIRTSLARLKELVAEATSPYVPGSIELRIYPYFLPMNFTAVDESGDGRILLEFCLPFSDQRLRMLFSKQRDGNLFLRVTENCERLWSISKIVTVGNVNSELEK